MKYLVGVFSAGLGSVKGFVHSQNHKGVCRRQRAFCQRQSGVLMQVEAEHFNGGDGSWFHQPCIMGIGRERDPSLGGETQNNQPYCWVFHVLGCDTSWWRCRTGHVGLE